MNNLLLFINLSVILLVTYASTTSSKSNDNIFIEASRQSLRSGEVHLNKGSKDEVILKAQKKFANSTIQQRQKRHGYPPALPPPVPVAPPAYPVYSYPTYNYPVYQPPVQVFQPQPIIQQPIIQQAIPQPIPQPSIIQPLPPLPQEPFIPRPIEPEIPSERFPLPSCYTDSSYFLCCSCELETVIQQSYWELRNEKGPTWKNANIQHIANRIQRNAETMFGEDFEVIVGLGDFVTASHFYKDLLCKIEREGRYMIAYATPRNETEYFDEGRGGFPPSRSPLQLDSIQTCDSQTSANLNDKFFANTINPYLLNKYTGVGDRSNNVATPFRI